MGLRKKMIKRKTMRKKNKITRRRTKNIRRKKTIRKTHRRKFQRGGNALVGSSYNINNLPGMHVSGTGIPNGNHYPLNTYQNTPFQYMRAENSLVGGGRRRKKRNTKKMKKRLQKGGMPGVTDIFNVGRYLQYEAGNTYNELQGYDKPVNPLPWADQYRGTTYGNFSNLK